MQPLVTPRPDAQDPKQAPPRRGFLGGAAAIVVAVLAKAKLLLGALKAVPMAKLLLTGGSFALSVLIYGARSGWAFGVGFVLLILIHELGHGLAMRSAGIRAGWPVFVPFLGAFIAMKDKPQHPNVEAAVAIAGPVAGTAASLVCAALGLFLHAPFFLALAYVGFYLNLFNLVPFGFLDGGRIARVFSRGAWIVGIVLMAGMFFAHPSPQLLVIGLMGLTQVFRRSNEDLTLVTDADRRTWAIRYFGLCFFLGAATFFTNRLLAHHELG